MGKLLEFCPFFCIFAPKFCKETMNITIDYPSWVVLLLVVFVLAWLIQLIAQLVIWLSPLRYARRTRTSVEAMKQAAQPGVSVLVYSHNQAEALARNLPVLLEQDYPDYEVIVIDDYSRDDTQDILRMMDQRSDRLLHTRIDEKARAMSHRKLAVYLGTKASHHELLLLTRAECLPASADWISGMARHFANPGVEVVLGPVVYQRRASFLSRFCQFDLLERLLWMLGVTLSTKPYAGWGQNMAFRKSTFYANNSQGYQRHLKIQPGEDDLFVATVARNSNVAVEMQAGSLVTDQSKPLFINWGLERLNRGFTSTMYAWQPQVMKVVDRLMRYLTLLPSLGLMGYAIYQLIAAPESLVSACVLLGIVVALLLVRMGLLIYTFSATSKVMHQKPMPFWSVFFGIYSPFVDVWFRCKALMRKKRFGVSRIGLH